MTAKGGGCISVHIAGISARIDKSSAFRVLYYVTTNEEFSVFHVPYCIRAKAVAHNKKSAFAQTVHASFAVLIVAAFALLFPLTYIVSCTSYR